MATKVPMRQGTRSFLILCFSVMAGIMALFLSPAMHAKAERYTRGGGGLGDLLYCAGDCTTYYYSMNRTIVYDFDHYWDENQGQYRTTITFVDQSMQMGDLRGKPCSLRYGVFTEIFEYKFQPQEQYQGEIQIQEVFSYWGDPDGYSTYGGGAWTTFPSWRPRAHNVAFLGADNCSGYNEKYVETQLP